MGMAGALAAFFGCPLGGSLFALEVNSRFGVEYFEHVSTSAIVKIKMLSLQGTHNLNFLVRFSLFNTDSRSFIFRMYLLVRLSTTSQSSYQIHLGFLNS
jgi:H+/Cl- antiporter ClcA